MRVNPKIGPTGVTEAAAQNAAEPPRLGSDKLALTGADALNAALAQTPDVRPEKVAQARASIAEDSYPSPQVIDQIAGLLAQDFTTKKSP